MILNGVELVGGDAVAGGGYGDVWKGSLQDELLAVKVVKVYQKSDVVKLLKVQFPLSVEVGSRVDVVIRLLGVLLRGSHMAATSSSQHSALLWCIPPD